MCIIVLNHDTTTLLMYVLLNDEYSKLNCQIFSVVSVYICTRELVNTLCVSMCAVYHMLSAEQLNQWEQYEYEYYADELTFQVHLIIYG